jgi:protein-disulfide isomerase
MLAGAEVGVTGTPAFFVNGRMLSGAQPVEAFKILIDDEISRSGN